MWATEYISNESILFCRDRHEAEALGCAAEERLIERATQIAEGAYLMGRHELLVFPTIHSRDDLENRRHELGVTARVMPRTSWGRWAYQNFKGGSHD